MQKILIPTDFSPVADNALDYAIEIAAKFKSELYLYHVYHIHKVDYDLDFPDDEQPYKKQLEQKMRSTKLKFTEKITQQGLSVQTIVEKDDVSSLFEKKVMKHEIELIVMGSKGASGLEKVIFGSVAATALEMAKVPVLVVPPKYPFLSLKQIVLAIDLNEISVNVLSPLQKLASKFGAKVTIIYVDTGSEDTNKKMDIPLKGVETTYRKVPMSTSINESINEFIKENKCDLLCMIRREKGFFESIFQESITQNQVYESKVPVLVLPEN